MSHIDTTVSAQPFLHYDFRQIPGQAGVFLALVLGHEVYLLTLSDSYCEVNVVHIMVFTATTAPVLLHLESQQMFGMAFF